MSNYHHGVGYDLSLTTSNRDKKKNDFELAKNVMDYYFFNTQKSKGQLQRYDENYDLMAGRWRTLENYEGNYNVSYKGQDFGVSGVKLRHYPIISQVTNAIYGDTAARKLVVSLKDLSTASNNYRERAKLKLTKGWFYQNMVQPLEDQIRMQYMQELGIQDPTSLPIEQQQQMQADLQKRIAEGVPQDLYDALEYVSTPEEVIFRSFLDFMLSLEKLENKFNVGALDSISVAEEYYKVVPHNGMPKIDVLNPRNVVWGGSEHTVNVEDGDYATYEQYRSVEEIISLYGKQLSKMDIDKLDALFIPSQKAGSHYENTADESRLKLTEVIANNPQIERQLNEPLTKEGQDKLKYLYQNYLGSGNHKLRPGALSGIQTKYVTWKWQQWMYLVTREVNGKQQQFFKSGHYVKDPSKGDLKVRKILVPQIWHGETLGSERDIKVNVGPVPFQYRSLNNPFDVKLTIHGGALNTFHNNTPNSSFVDLGKPANFEYNTIKTFLEKLRRNHMGKILLFDPTILPDEWDMKDFMTSLKITNIGLVEAGITGNPQAMQDIRAIDFNQMPDISATIQQAEAVKNEVYESMLFNRAKLGQLGQYATATNSQLSVNASDTQLVMFHKRRREIKESVLESALNLAVNLWKDNDDVKNIILDDFSIAYLEANPGALNMADLALFVEDDFLEERKIKEVKMRMQELSQNGATLEDLIAIAKADSMTELEQWARKFTRRNEKMEMRRHEQNMEMVNKETQKEMSLEKLKRDVELLISREKNQVDLERADIQADTLRRGYDTDNNKIPDAVQSKMLDIEAKKEMQEKQLSFEEKKNEKDRKAKEREEKLKRQLERLKIKVAEKK